MAKVYCIGEALIDFVPAQKGVRLEDVEHFVRAPGGAPANVAVAAKKLGAESAFIGKVGRDAFGRLLEETLRGCGVDTSWMKFTQEANTTLAFVARKADGDRDFIFYRKPGADMLLAEEDIPANLFARGDVLHFGSLGLVDAPVKYAHDRALALAKEAGAVISFDPNVRLDLWEDYSLCKERILEYLPKADVVKMSLDEMPFIFDTDREEEVAARCFDLGVSLVMVTRGKEGSAMYVPGCKKEATAIDVAVEDTTGAGDAYTGAVLSSLAGVDNLRDFLTPETITEMIAFANVAGSLATTKKGAIAAIPTLEEVQAFLS